MFVSTIREGVSLTQITREINDLEAKMKRQAEENQRQLLALQAEARAVAHREYYLKYGEWDWIVRKEYMNLVKSVAHQWPFSDDTRGYAFELWNMTPRLPHGMMDNDLRLDKPEYMLPYNEKILSRETLTEFVKPEHIGQCQLTPRILDAFVMLKYLLPTVDVGRGFGMSRKEEAWKGDGQSHGDPYFDYEGWKFHLAPTTKESKEEDAE